MDLNIKLNTVVLLVGPSMCGKSTFANMFKEKVQSQGLKNNVNVTCSIVSSDELRRELSGVNYHKYDRKMLEASSVAFEELYNRVNKYASFPFSQHFIIVDSTGLDNNFRTKIKDIAQSNGYATALCLFNYKNEQDYFAAAEVSSEEYNFKSVIENHISKMKQNVLKNLSKKDFDFVFEFKKRESNEDLLVNIQDLSLYSKCLVDLDSEKYSHVKNVVIYGDAHESIKELKTLYSQFNEDETLFISLGDYIDKGGYTREMIDFLTEKENTLLVVGNHERFVMGRITGALKENSNADVNFSSLDVLLNDKVYADKFLTLFKRAQPFFKIEGKNVNTMYLTHAPCKEKYLGKVNDKALKAQRNLRYLGWTDDEIVKTVEFFFNERRKGFAPLHFVGHIAHKSNQLKFDNKIMLDSGCVYGNKLSACVVNVKDFAFSFKSVKSSYEKDDLINFSDIFDEKKPVLPEETNSEGFNFHEGYEKNLKSIGFFDQKKIDELAKSSICFVSGTVSPSEKTAGRLETIDTALNYYKKNKIDKLIVEPKYMGSRCQLYLFNNDKNQDFAVSRNGNIIKIRNEKVFSIWRERVSKIFDKWDSIILDGELLPWSAWGEGLINNEFISYSKLVEKELSLLKGDAIFDNFEIGKKYKLSKREDLLNIYKKQLSIYAKDLVSIEDIHFKAFSIVKKDDQNMLLSSNIEVFEKLNFDNDDYLVIDLNDDNAFVNANNFFKTITTEKGMEGVVVKPDKIISSVAPYLKVRNEEYLTLIYGYDYKNRLESLLKNKNIKLKLELSIKEFNINDKLISSKTIEEKKFWLSEMFKVTIKEKEVDPRL